MDKKPSRNLPQSDAGKLQKQGDETRNLRQERYPSQTAPESGETVLVPRLPESPDATPADRRLTSGTRLSTVQRRLVLRLMIEYDDVATVSDILAREYPEIPLISDRSLRQYQSGRREEYAELRNEIESCLTQTRLAQRQTRIAHLIYHYKRLQGIKLANDQSARKENRGIDPQLDLVREMRALLEQIAQEAGDRPDKRSFKTPPSDTQPPGMIYSIENPQARSALEASVDKLIEEREAMRRADLLSLPPQIDTTRQTDDELPRR